MKKTSLFCSVVFITCLMALTLSCQWTIKEITRQIIYDEIMYTLHNKLQNDPDIPDPVPADIVSAMVKEQNKELDKNKADFHIKDTQHGQSLKKSISLEDFKKRFIRVDVSDNGDTDDSPLTLKQLIIYNRIIDNFYNNLQKPQTPDIIPASKVAEMVMEHNEELSKNDAGFHIRDTQAGEDLKKSISKDDLKIRLKAELDLINL